MKVKAFLYVIAAVALAWGILAFFMGMSLLFVRGI